MNTRRRPLVRLILREWRALSVAGLASVLVAAAELARPWPLALVINGILSDHPEQRFSLDHAEVWALIGIAGLVLLIAMVDAVASYQSDLRLGMAGERILHDMRVAVYGHLQRLSLAFHQKRPTGDLVTRVTGDVNAVGDLFSSSLGTMVSSVLLLIGMVVVSLLVDPLLALATFATVPLLALLTFVYRRRLKAVSRRQRAKEGEIASVAAEALAAMPVVKAHGSEDIERARVELRSTERRRLGMQAYRIEARFTGAVDVLGAIAAALVIVVGVFRIAAGALSPGDLVVFSQYARRAYRPVRDLAKQAGRVSRAMARVDRIEEILAADQLLETRADGYRGGRAHGDVALTDVTFSYDKGREAVTDVTLDIPGGTRLAVVGRSGAGKSTLGALVARFYDPVRGAVRIDGRDARDCDLSWLREQVGLVLQDTMLFTGTVADNIAYGTSASREELIAAARAAGAHAFISELPDGYDSPLGSEGSGLSGGQRQRIAIARTLLRDPPILVLDEPTTGLDADSEAQVMESLSALIRGRTTIFITHSLALARDADRVVVLEGGRVVQEGMPADMLARHGPFRHFAAEQGVIARPPRTPQPHDPVLPHMGRLLDPVAMAPHLQRALGDGAALPEVKLHYLRYKPREGLIALYDVDTETGLHQAMARISARSNLAQQARDPRNLALAERVDGRSPAREPLRYDLELDALIQWFPLDIALPALAEPPDGLARRLERAGLEFDGVPSLRRLGYHPRRRAVLGLGNYVLKIYTSRDDFMHATVGLRASASVAGVRTPELAAWLPDLRVTVQTVVPGRSPADRLAFASEAGHALRTLHEAEVEKLPRTPPARHLDATRPAAGRLQAIHPPLAGRIESLLARFEETTPSVNGFVPSHGDFYARQLVVHDGELAIVDFDQMCLAPPEFDVATYGAHLVKGEEGDLARALEAIELVQQGYGRRPPEVRWYLATSILRRAGVPFRRKPDHRWPERVERMVDAAERALAA